MIVVFGSGPTAVCVAGRCVLTVVAGVFRGGLNLSWFVCPRRSEPKISSSSLYCCVPSSIKLSESESVVLYVALLVSSLVVKAVILFLLNVVTLVKKIIVFETLLLSTSQWRDTFFHFWCWGFIHCYFLHHKLIRLWDIYLICHLFPEWIYSYVDMELHYCTRVQPCSRPAAAAASLQWLWCYHWQ